MIKIYFIQLSTEFTLVVVTGLETMSECLFSFHYTVYHNDTVLSTFAQAKMNIQVYKSFISSQWEMVFVMTAHAQNNWKIFKRREEEIKFSKSMKAN